MSKFSRLQFGLLALLVAFGASAPALAQSAPQGWMGGSQSPGFPAQLNSTRPTVVFDDSPQPPNPQATPGQTPTSPQSMPGTAPTTGQQNAGTGQAPAAAPAAGSAAAPAADSAGSGWTLLKDEFQSGIASASGGKFANTKYKWYGFVRLDGIFDFNPIGSTDDFVTSSIPVPQGRGQNAVLTPRYTRIGFDTSTPWKDMDWDINTKIELDFFNGNTSGAFGSFPLRLRFAYIDFGPFRFGQAASLFMDYDVFPDVLDYEGPPGMVLMRQPIASFKCTPCEGVTVNVGIEQPYSDISWDDGTGFTVNPGTGIITQPGVARNVQDCPDFTANIRYKWACGHFQVAGIARKLTFQPVAGSDDNKLGAGVNFTGSFNIWACCCGCMPEKDSDRTPLQKSRILGQYACGRGINRYIQDINGFGLDAVFDPLNGFDALRSTGWFVCYEHFWCDNWISNICYGEARTQLPDTVPDGTYKGAKYFAVNLIWLPVERMGVGIEYLIGQRENKDGQSADAHRLQMGIQYKF